MYGKADFKLRARVICELLAFMSWILPVCWIISRLRENCPSNVNQTHNVTVMFVRMGPQSLRFQLCYFTACNLVSIWTFHKWNIETPQAIIKASWKWLKVKMKDKTVQGVLSLDNQDMQLGGALAAQCRRQLIHWVHHHLTSDLPAAATKQ